MTPSLPQPQRPNNAPPEYHTYKYITHDQLEVDWLGSVKRLEKYLDGSYVNDDSMNKNEARYEPGTLVWVLQSKGRQHSNFNSKSECISFMLHKKRRDKKHTRALEKMVANGGDSTNRNDTNHVDCSNAVDENKRRELEENTNPHYGYHSKSEMFQRARVVCDEDPLNDDVSYEKRMQRRVKVRYSRGSTYCVRAFNLVPVLEEGLQIIMQKPSAENEMHIHDAGINTLPPMVIVTPETHIYRRIAKTHTTPGDSFMEIGCDYGITVDKIRKAMEEAGDVPVVWPNETGVANKLLECSKEDNGVSCLGVDKSYESISIANDRFPQCKFTLCNILKPEDMSSLNQFCVQTLRDGAPSVVAIDVNGNRDVEGVLDCLQIVMNENWVRQPRLIIVKSRFFYWDLKKLRE